MTLCGLNTSGSRVQGGMEDREKVGGCSIIPVGTGMDEVAMGAWRQATAGENIERQFISLPGAVTN